MTAGKHTPWKATRFADDTVGVHAPDGSPDGRGWIEIAILRGRFAHGHARLIVAAPDMLEALQFCLGQDLSPEANRMVRAAISKAQEK